MKTIIAVVARQARWVLDLRCLHTIYWLQRVLRTVTAAQLVPQSPRWLVELLFVGVGVGTTDCNADTSQSQ